MSRFDFSKKRLGVYLTVGDPDAETTLACADAAVKAGADFLELGMPFSDPSADGPTIQRAMERALARGTSLQDVLRVARGVRAKHPHVPIVLFGYANPFYQALRKGQRFEGVADALLIVDVPVEHRAPFKDLDVDLITLVGPNPTPERLKHAAEAKGFIYQVALAGVTGVGQGDLDTIQKNVERVRAVTKTPICVGFGVKTEDDARKIAQFADGVIAGSVFVDQIGGKADGAAERVAAKVAELRRGVG